jgi:hypothetical protein
MDERGLTAYIFTIHTPAATLAIALGLLVSALAMIVVRGRSLPVRAWIGALWFVGVVVVGYAGVCRLMHVRGFDAESISLFP